MSEVGFSGTHFPVKSCNKSKAVGTFEAVFVPQFDMQTGSEPVYISLILGEYALLFLCGAWWWSVQLLQGQFCPLSPLSLVLTSF